MTKSRSLTAILAASAAIAALVALTPAAALAQPQNKTQQGCINTMNKTGAKLAATQGKDITACIKDAGAGKLTTTAEVCLTDDRKGKVGKAETKVSDGETKKCVVPLPSYGYTGSAAVIAGAESRELEATAAIYGSPLDTAIIDASVDKTGAGCQTNLSKTAEKYAATYLKDFLGCKKGGLKDASIVNAGGLEDCIGNDEKGKVDKAAVKVKDGLDKKCGGVTLATAFPGACAGATATNQDFADCVNAVMACSMCQAINDMDGIEAPCDDLDNGVLDGSCPQCGNGFVDAGEDCDDGGQSASCEANCEFQACGDGILNTLAGEECDDGNTDPADGCTNDCTICGNDVVTAPEECDDGDLDSGDGCSSSCECSIAAGESGCPDPQCPNNGILTLFGGTTDTPCASDPDCTTAGVPGTCDTGLGVCVTDTDLDTGWKGIAHNADINNQAVARGDIICPGPGPVCGECVVNGLDESTGDCRCDNDNRTECDQPFEADDDDCGGATCNCYFGDPLPLSSGNVPACVVNRFAEDVTGTGNVDTGSAEITARLRPQVFLGENVINPCPSCGGTCTAPPASVGDGCSVDLHCDSTFNAGDGVCGNYDPTPDDGVRGGTCYLGANDGESCDIGVINTTFPAPGGGGSSLDCFPDPGKNVSGLGLQLTLEATTGTASLPPRAVPCGFPGVAPDVCACGVCEDAKLVGCTTNADCPTGGPCRAEGGTGNGINGQPNSCSDGVCTDDGSGISGECLANTLDKHCDLIVRANGEGFVACTTNADCGSIGVDAGACALTSVRPCFLDPVTISGTADPGFPVGVAAFCIPPTGNPGINTVAGLPGAGRVKNVTASETLCPDGVTVYTPGVGGCP